MDISLSGIEKKFEDSGRDRWIFKNMTAGFVSGQFSVIIGKSGVGKSSLLNLISGIDTPDSGLIQIGSSRVSDMDDTERTLFRRRHIGFIYQFFNLIPVLSVFDNITLVCRLDNQPRADYEDRALALLDQVGLFRRQNDYPDKLSGGEQQRVAIVRAMVNDPDIILADEPTGNLDQETGQQVLDMISYLARENQKTLVMVTHSTDAMACADRSFRVEDQQLTDLGRELSV